jgi:sugar lactone lactonase YvrE
MRSIVARLVAMVVLGGGTLVSPTAAGSGPAAGGAVPGVTAAGYDVRYLVPPNPLNITDGLVLDGRGGLFICQALINRVVRLDLATGGLTVIADEFDAEPLQVPDDITLGPDGNLYVTNLLGRNVVRMSPDGRNRQVVASNLGDGNSLANSIAFNTEGRLFATDLSFADPTHPGGLWEIDPAGVKPAIPVIRPMPTPNGFAFGPDGLAYIPQMFAGRIDVVDVDSRAVRTLVDGFGYLTSVRMDLQSNLVVLETDTGKVWRVDRLSGARTLLAQGEPGLDNAVVHPDGEIWVTNFNRGGLRRVNVATGTLEPVLPDRPLTLPFSLSEAPDGSIVVGDFTSVNRVRDGHSTRLSLLLNSDLQLLSPGAVQIGSDVYLSDFLPPNGRIFRLDTKTGKREQVAGGFGFPWTVREGAGGRLLVGDQALGAVFEVDPGTGSKTPVVQGLTSPSGLAFDPSRGVVYVSDTGGGRVLAVDLATRRPSVVASGLDTPEGVALDGDGSLLVVEGGTGRLLRVDPPGGGLTEVAAGLPTKTVGFGLPLMNYSADVLVRSDGGIVVSGAADGSLTELRRS